MKVAKRLLWALPLLLLSPVVVVVAIVVLAIADLAFALFGRKRLPASRKPAHDSATVVIPNWNGRDLLEKYLPSVIAALADHPRNEVIVVDNGSTDGSADFVEAAFPSVRLLRLEKNLGFGGGSNAGFSAAKNDIVVLLNSDMRVEREFLTPLLESFADPDVFAVACQIFFSDPTKLREETGLTQAWWHRGRLRVAHRIDGDIKSAFPCFYGGGGSCAFDRHKFLELGGFDHTLRPFYLEDTDLGYMAWKRGWKVLYEPRSIVFHEHRGTIGKKFSSSYISGVLKKNFVLWTWKNIHSWSMLLTAFAYAWFDAILSAVFGESPERATLAGLARAFVQLPDAIGSRWRAKARSLVTDREAFRRPLGGYYRDRFAPLPSNPDRLSVLFLSPYPICPPIHGGGVFMYQTSRELAKLCDLHLIILLDFPEEAAAHEELERAAASVRYLARMKGAPHQFATLAPHAVVEFQNRDFEWLMHREILLRNVDVVQYEYMQLGQYRGDFQRIVNVIFEHDLYFQSVRRQTPGIEGAVARLKARLEYLRAIRYELELLPKFDGVQVCTDENRKHLESFVPELKGHLDDRTRAGIDASRYPLTLKGRTPDTLLFLGSFRHLPNMEAVRWFVRYCLPHVAAARPQVRLVLVGSDPPPRHFLPESSSEINLRGFVEDVREPLSEYAIFICPILSGSGVRVKLLEAFASGIPVVSTRIGAEGLADQDGEICALADTPEEFARKVVELLEDPERARQMAQRARAFVENTRDIRVLTAELAENYRELIQAKRQGALQPASNVELATHP